MTAMGCNEPLYSLAAGRSKLPSTKQRRPLGLPSLYERSVHVAKLTMPTSYCPRCVFNSADIWKNQNKNLRLPKGENS